MGAHNGAVGEDVTRFGFSNGHSFDVWQEVTDDSPKPGKVDAPSRHDHGGFGQSRVELLQVGWKKVQTDVQDPIERDEKRLVITKAPLEKRASDVIRNRMIGSGGSKIAWETSIPGKVLLLGNFDNGLRPSWNDDVEEEVWISRLLEFLGVLGPFPAEKVWVPWKIGVSAASVASSTSVSEQLTGVASDDGREQGGGDHVLTREG